MALKVGELFATIGLDDSAFGKGLDSAQKSFSNLSAMLAKTGAALSLAVTVPLVALGKQILNAGTNFQTGMSEVSAISGATGAELDALTRKAREMGATTKFSASQSAEALKYMAMAGWNTEKMLGGIEGIMNLAAAEGGDLGSVADIVTDALTAFGLAAQDSTQFADVLAAASSASNTSVTLLGGSFKYAAATAGALGYTAEDVAISLGLMANAGIKGEMAGTQLRNIMAGLASPTKQQTKALKQLGVSAVDSDGNMRPLNETVSDLRTGFAELTDSQRAQYAETLAGKEGMSGLLALVGASDEDFARLTQSIYHSGGAAAKMAAIMQDNLGGDWTTLTSGLEGAMIGMFDSVQETLRGFVQRLSAAVSWFNGLDAGVMRSIVVFGAFAAATGPLLVGLSGLFKVLARSTGALSFLTGPVGLAAAGLVILYKACKPVQNAVKKMGQFFKTFFGMLGDGKDTLTAIKTALVMAFGGDAYQQVMGALSAIQAGWGRTVKWIVDTGDGVRDAFSRGSREGGLFGGIVESARYLGPRVGDMLKQGWASITTTARNLGATALKALGSALQKTEHFKGLGKALVEAGLALGEGESIDFSGLLTAFKDGVTLLGADCLTWIGGGMAGTSFSQLGTALTKAAGQLKAGETVDLSGLFPAFLNGVRDFYNNTLKPYLDGIDWSGMWKSFWSVMTNVEKWLQGVSFSAGYLVGLVAKGLLGLGEKLIAAVKAELQVGEGQGLTADDFWDALGMVAGWFEDLAGKFIAGIVTGFTGQAITWDQIKTSIAGWLDEATKSFTAWADSLVKTLKDKLDPKNWFGQNLNSNPQPDPLDGFNIEKVLQSGGSVPTSPAPIVSDAAAQRLREYIDLYGQLYALNKHLSKKEQGNAIDAGLKEAGFDTSQMKVLEALSHLDFSEVASSLNEAYTTVQKGGTITPELGAELQHLKSLFSDAGLYGLGDDLMAGIARNMMAYGWDGSSVTVMSCLEASLRSAASSNSPAQLTMPLGNDIAAGIGEGMSKYDFGSNAATTASALLAALTTALTGFKEKGSVLGLDFSSGLAIGILSGKSGVINAATQVATAAALAAKTALDIGSPSRLMRKYGAFTSKGLGLGMLDEIGYVIRSASGVARAASDALSVRPTRSGSVLLGRLSGASATPAGGLDYDRLAPALADAMAQRPAYFSVNGRCLAEATAADNQRALYLRGKRRAEGYGGR